MANLVHGNVEQSLWQKPVTSVLTSLILSIFLITGCSHEKTTRVVPEKQVERLCPPSTLMVQESVPAYTGRVWSDLVTYSKRLRAIIQKQNADKAAIEQFCQEQ